MQSQMDCKEEMGPIFNATTMLIKTKRSVTVAGIKAQGLPTARIFSFIADQAARHFS